jgi:hypothetical protein
MKKMMIAALSLSLLTGTASLFAQDSGKMDSTDTTAKKKHGKKKKKDTTATSSTASK